MHNTKMRSALSVAFAGLMAAGLSVGCGGSGTSVATGTVTGEVKRMTGEPFGNVNVVFHPESGPSVVTKTNESGQFTATVPLGASKVAVIAEGSATSEDTSPSAITAPKDKKPAIDPRYASPESSGLVVTVEKQQKEKVVFVVE